MADPGPFVGRGRAADVYDLGGGRVLRRYRISVKPGLIEREAAAMAHLRAHGFPVPEVFDAGGTDLVMERLHGVTMLHDLETKPWRLRRHADLWASLHRRLAAVPVGDLGGTVPHRFGPPDGVLHLDFHPDNIMLTADGPMVFDWSNVAVGPPAADVAIAWILGLTASVDGSRWLQVVVAAFRRRLIDRFVDQAGRAAALAILPAVADYRLADRNNRPEEIARIEALVAALT